MKKHPNLCRVFLFFIGVFLAALPTQAKVYDFENESDNAHWHFINGAQTNKWVINTAAGSNTKGTRTLYISADGTSYSYTNTTSTVWAYCDVVLTGDVTLSFDYKGIGENSYDYMYAYLIPVSANQPTAGSTTVPLSAIQLGSRFNGQSDWSTYTDSPRTLTGQYYLYFMWVNDGSVNKTPIAIDNVALGNLYQSFDILQESITQTTANIIAKYTGDAIVKRLGYVFEQDTMWNADNTSDSIVFSATNLIPNSPYSLGIIAELDSIDGDSIPLKNDINLSEWYQYPSNSWETRTIVSDGNKSRSVYSTQSSISTWIIHNLDLIANTEYTITFGAFPYSSDVVVEIGFGMQLSTTMDTIILQKELSGWYGDTLTYTPVSSGTYYIGLHVINPFGYYVDVQQLCVTCPPFKTTKQSAEFYGFTTESVDMSMSFGTPTQTTIPLSFSYDCGDAVNAGTNGIEYRQGTNFSSTYDTDSIRFNSSDIQDTMDTVLNGLRPNTQYAFRPYVDVESVGRMYGPIQVVYTEPVLMNVSLLDKTQKTLSLGFWYDCGDMKFDHISYRYKQSSSSYYGSSSYWYNEEASDKLDTVITNLSPGTSYDIEVSLYVKNSYSAVLTTTKTFTTENIIIHAPEIIDCGQTFVLFKSASEFGDADIASERIEVSRTVYRNKKPASNMGMPIPSYDIDTTLIIVDGVAKFNNLSPNTAYAYRSVITTTDGKLYKSSESFYWPEFTTLPITLTTQFADGISNTSALLHGTVDCDQESYTEIGFEWKRNDAPATVKPQRLLVTDRVDENLLFRLEGLSGDRYYDFRTYCFYRGESYYGEWVGFLTSDKEVLVAPTVQTVGATANEQGAEMEGFIVTGTEPILQKGFEVWIKGGTDVKTTVAEGRIIRALIPEPWSYTTYQYKAYAKTASGTTYGETMEITTGYIPRDVQDIVVTPSSNSAEVTWTEIEVADYYILTLFADEAMTETLAVYRVGTDGSISRLRMPSAVKALVTCSINDLLPDTDYYFAVVAYNGADQKVAEESGTFQTEPDPTGIRQITDEPATAVRKILYRGQILILRGDKVYTLTGQEIR